MAAVAAAMNAVAWHHAAVLMAGSFDGTWRFPDLFVWGLIFVLPLAFVLGTVFGLVCALAFGRSESKQLLQLNGRAFVTCWCAAMWVGVLGAMLLAARETPMTLHHFLGSVLVLVFWALAILHVYWAFGGRRGLHTVVPEVDGQPVFRLDFTFSFLTLLVAVLLATAGGLSAVQGQLSWFAEPCRWSRLGMWGLSAVFALRAIGEFRLVGFFKRVKGTTFATWDTRLFSPLCLAIALMAGTLAWLPL